MDKKKIIPKILLDLSKAFDSTDHDRLLYKICYTATVYGHVIGRAICQAALKQFVLDLQLYMYIVWRSTNHPWGTSRCHFITFTLLQLHEWPTQCEAIILFWVMHWSLQTISLISTGKH